MAAANAAERKDTDGRLQSGNLRSQHATLPLLDSSEKETLFHRIKNGDQQARELYITGNLRLVLSVIGRFSSSGENIDDLFQIGCIGLMKAIDNFDLSHQVNFQPTQFR